MRAIAWVVGVSSVTVLKLLTDAGAIAAHLHDEMVRDVPAKRVQVDELYAFVWRKDNEVWSWVALDMETCSDS